MKLPEKKQFFSKKNQRGVVLWFTGLSGAGKTTIANELDQLLIANKNHSYILDGDVIRGGLKFFLFTKKDREENLRRIKYVGQMFCDAGIISIVTFISPFKAERKKARDRLDYIEVYVKGRKRDAKGLYIREQEMER